MTGLLIIPSIVRPDSSLVTPSTPPLGVPASPSSHPLGWLLPLPRLLGENKQISLQTDRKEYWTGEPVRIYANVLNESFETVEKEQYDVFIEKLGAAKGKEKLNLFYQ